MERLLLASQDLRNSTVNVTGRQHQEASVRGKASAPVPCQIICSCYISPPALLHLSISTYQHEPEAVTMDSSVSQLDLEQLNEKDKAELRQFVGNENQRTRVRERKHTLFSSKQCGIANVLLLPYYRDPRPDRYLLEEVRDRLGEERGAGQGRAELLSELR